jgi:hypothetical protein
MPNRKPPHLVFRDRELSRFVVPPQASCRGPRYVVAYATDYRGTVVRRRTSRVTRCSSYAWGNLAGAYAPELRPPRITGRWGEVSII